MDHVMPQKQLKNYSLSVKISKYKSECMFMQYLDFNISTILDKRRSFGN